jgi:transposase-like protein
MPNQMNGTECPRCRRNAFVRGERVMRGREAFVNYKCGACRYSWQVKDQEQRRPTESPASSGQRHTDS